MPRQPKDRPYMRKIEFVFFNEKEIREAVDEAREDSKTPELRNGSGCPDPTASTAIRNLSPIPSVMIDGVELKSPESWLAVIDKTYNWCKRQGEKYYEFARSRYKGEYFVKACVKAEASTANFYMILERIRNYAAIQAAWLRLIYVE